MKDVKECHRGTRSEAEMSRDYLLLKVEETAVQIEQPFGYEYNDLPLEA